MKNRAATVKILGAYLQQAQFETQVIKADKTVSGEEHEKGTWFIHYSIHITSHHNINQVIIFSIYQGKSTFLNLNSQIGFIKRRMQLQHDHFVNPNLSLKYLH